MAFDFKRANRAYYLPGRTPGVVDVPEMRFAAVRGSGDPNAPDGAYARALRILYGVAYTIRMSARGGRAIEGFFDYVVPPLEGFWWQDGAAGIDPSHKERFQWISAIRLPDFVTPADLAWAAGEAGRRKRSGFSGVEFMKLTEGLCVQCMHLGPYDDEPATLERMHRFMAEQGLEPDFTPRRRHHEIYLSDARRTAPERLKTVIRLPVRRGKPPLR